MKEVNETNDFNRIKEVLIEKDMKPLDLANLLKISLQTVYKWQNQTNQPTIKQLYQIAEKLNINVQDLLIKRKTNDKTKNQSSILEKRFYASGDNVSLIDIFVLANANLTKSKKIDLSLVSEKDLQRFKKSVSLLLDKKKEISKATPYYQIGSLHIEFLIEKAFVNTKIKDFKNRISIAAKIKQIHFV